MFSNFESYMTGMISQYGSLNNLVIQLSKILFFKTNNPDNLEIANISPSKIKTNKFYLIKYNYNGNKIWCPILTLEYKVHKNKNLLYSINLEYLPPKYKILLFSRIFKGISRELDIVVDNARNIFAEYPIPFTFESIYKVLKNNGNMNYCITAYDMNKISDCYLVSVKLSPYILMFDSKPYNSASMKELFTKISGTEQLKLKDILEQYEKIIEEYQEDSIEYHKNVSLFEQKLKLFDDVK